MNKDIKNPNNHYHLFAGDRGFHPIYSETHKEYSRATESLKDYVELAIDDLEIDESHPLAKSKFWIDQGYASNAILGCQIDKQINGNGYDEDVLRVDFNRRLVSIDYAEVENCLQDICLTDPDFLPL